MTRHDEAQDADQPALVSQAMFTIGAEVVVKALFKTENEQPGQQLGLGIGGGERPVEALPMFASNALDKGGDDGDTQA